MMKTKIIHPRLCAWSASHQSLPDHASANYHLLAPWRKINYVDAESRVRLSVLEKKKKGCTVGRKNPKKIKKK